MLSEKSFATAQLTLSYGEGPRTGPPLLLLHGLAGDRRSWDVFFPVLASGWHLFACDLRGHGSSGRVAGRYHLSDYVQDVVAFLEHLPEPATVMAHSLGALVALGAAAVRPERVRALVLLDPPLFNRKLSIDATPAFKEWLERSAGQFNQITPGSPDQPLLNDDFPSYNFDVIDGVTYEIDLSQPSKYDADGNLMNENAERIVNLRYNGEPVADDQEFLVATNNYRASGGGAFPGLDGSTIVIDSPDENRQILIDYLTETETVNPSADANWSFTDLPGEVTATFESAAAAREALPEGAAVTFEGPSAEGFGTYQITF